MTATSEPESHGAAQAYEAIAPVYDDFTSHHDYELWIGNLLPELRRHGLRGDRLLDLGCGTGKSFLPMLARGWKVTACDLSPAMLERARAKAGNAVELHVADLRELPVLGAFDLVWTLGDVLNYLLDPADLTDALRGMRANLAPGGLALLDANTLGQLRDFFTGTQVVERDGRTLRWRGEAPVDLAPRSICRARFEVEANAGRDAAVETRVHRQRHFPMTEVLECIAEAGLECLDVFGHGHDVVIERPLDESTHAKAIYIARAA